ncbi:MAG: hypothetical protein IJM30_10625 [Thermoguttaceae bacterium]|nr:hypothetical protein [Thermoguttaceae bacterium]
MRLFGLFFALLVAVGTVASANDGIPEFDKGRLEREFKDPPREFTVMPFWFWNDKLDEKEIARQIASFEEKGVYGFTIHPRIGLPEDEGWMSEKLLSTMRVALEEARRRGMFVLLYDEGMYPSGSSAGQVVAEDPAYAARGFLRVPLKEDGTPKDEKVRIGDDWNLAGTFTDPQGESEAIYDAPSGGVIRGLHYIGDESKNPGEFSPPASDLLNRDAVATFVRLVYQRFYDEFKEYFDAGVVVGIFTDEPSILGRGSRRGMQVGNLQALPTINKYLGYDFTPHLPELWRDWSPESPQRRKEYNRAVKLALEEIYYGALSEWCAAHGTKLCGHPEQSADIGVLRKFQIPGQDLVWRYIEPGEKAFDPGHSPMAKCASSAALHNGARRNMNEAFGAYGHDLTYEETVWLVNWLVVRGQNMIVPHAFYYSIRGPRFEERPPDVGPNSLWWDDYKTFADYCARICWLNTDSKPWAPTALLVDSNVATSWGTKTLFERQLDFNYLEFRSLVEDATIDDDGISVGGGFYKTLALTPGYDVPKDAEPILKDLARQGRVLRWSDQSAPVEGAKLARNDDEAVAAILETSGSDVETISGDSSGLRARRVSKGPVEFYFLFNEVDKPLDATLTFSADQGGEVNRWDPWTGEIAPLERNSDAPKRFKIELKPYETTIIGFTNE